MFAAIPFLPAEEELDGQWEFRWALPSASFVEPT